MKFLALLAAGLMAVLSPLRAETTVAMLTSNTDTGTVTYKVPGAADFAVLKWKDTVKAPVGTVVKTNDSGIARIDIFPGGKVVVMPNSTATIEADKVTQQGDTISGRSGEIDLQDGEVKSLLSHRGAYTSPIDFSIKTPTCVAAAKGTKYIVFYDAKTNITYVLVITGDVLVGGLNVTDGELAAIGSNGIGKLIGMTDVPPSIRDDLNAGVTITTTDNGSNQVDAASTHQPGSSTPAPTTPLRGG
jgi:hypothetical protein